MYFVSSNVEDSKLESAICQAGQSKQESTTKYLVQASWGDSPDSHTPALKSLPKVVDPWSQGGAEVDVGSEGVHKQQVFAVSANAAEKSEARIDTLEPASTGAPLPEKRILVYTDDGMVNDSSTIALFDEGLNGTTKVEATKASSKTVDRGPP